MTILASVVGLEAVDFDSTGNAAEFFDDAPTI